MTNKVIFVAVAAAIGLCGLAQQKEKILAQQIVEDIRAGHPEVTGLELAAARSAKAVCRTIAATEAKEIGAKCDKDEFTAMKTNQPFVEKEEEGFDITMPLHESSGTVIGTVGIDFKPEPGQREATVVGQAKQIAGEIEKRITTRTQLFELVK